jgi:hypothetical protein
MLLSEAPIFALAALVLGSGASTRLGKRRSATGFALDKSPCNQAPATNETVTDGIPNTRVQLLTMTVEGLFALGVTLTSPSS